MKRTIIVGDVHGCYDELLELLNVVECSSEDRVIFVGDMINKGPKSLEVLKLIKERNFEAVIGNHELAFIRYCRANDYESQSFKDIKDSMGNHLEEWLNWLDKLPRYIEDENFIVVHAGVPPESDLKDISDKVITNIRTWDGQGKSLSDFSNPAWFDFYKKDKLIVFGHWAQLGLVEKENVIGLDSGCVYGNSLSCVILPERKIVSIPAKKVYQAIK